MNNFKANLLISVLIMGIIALMTYPLFLNITTYMPGFFSTDESYAVVWNAWMTKFSVVHNLSVKNTDLIAYPFGIDFFKNQPVGILWFSINYVLALLGCPPLSFNLQALMNLFLAGFLTYLLVYSLTKERLAGLFSAVIFGFCPYLFMRSWQHLGETYVWTMVLAVWSLLKLKDSGKINTKIAVAISFVVATVNLFIMVYIILIIAVLIMYLIVRWRKNRTFMVRVLLCSFIGFLLLLPQLYPVVKEMFLLKTSSASAFNPYHRPFEDLFYQSARPLSYFLPAVVHPVFGRITEYFLGSQLYGISIIEHTLYLGWIPLILTLVALRRYRKDSRLRAKSCASGTDNDFFYVGFFILLAIVAWFFSQPPWWKIGPVKILMPSFFMYKLLPMFRAYCRFGIVVMLAVAVLAGFGLKFILERFKGRTLKTSISAVFCCLVLFEFWNYPPFKVIDLSRFPKAYDWLKEQHQDFALAEYPLDAESPNDMYKLYQTRHEKKIINGTVATSANSYAHEVAQAIVKLSSPKTAGILKWMGVKYALVHREDYLKTEIIEDKEELEKIPQNPNLRFIRTFPSEGCPQKDILCAQKTGPIDVYEVVAPIPDMPLDDVRQ